MATGIGKRKATWTVPANKAFQNLAYREVKVRSQLEEGSPPPPKTPYQKGETGPYHRRRERVSKKVERSVDGRERPGALSDGT